MSGDAMVRADVVLARCGQDGNLYGMRVEEVSAEAWETTWAFTIDEARAHRAGYGEQLAIRASLGLREGFPGCPYCEAETFVRCGRCERMTCWRAGDQHFACGWPGCHGSGVVSDGGITTFGSGGDV